LTESSLLIEQRKLNKLVDDDLVTFAQGDVDGGCVQSNCEYGVIMCGFTGFGAHKDYIVDDLVHPVFELITLSWCVMFE
jgi:hypothetical protein